jgi:hypothetical protein
MQYSDGDKMMYNDVYDEILEWEIRHLAAVTERLFKTGKTYRYPRKEKLKEYRRHRGVTDFSGAKKVLKRVRNRKIHHLSVEAERLVTPGEFRKAFISFEDWL